MTTSLKNTEIGHSQGSQHDPDLSFEQIKQKALARRLRAARSLAARMQVSTNGARTFIRFSQAQRVEHQLLIVSFTTLAITGLLQRYSEFNLPGAIINSLGGIDTIRTIHHLAAVIMILQSVYHLGNILVLWFVKRERGSMWPHPRDFLNLFGMVRYNVGLARERPQFDRFTPEEKLEYWALLWGTPLMIITGLSLWFPTIVTRVLPGQAIPIALALHTWEAVLATLAILTWHMYHVLIKERNFSIFNGKMSEEQMLHEHPLEYRRILAADEYLQKLNGEKESAAAALPIGRSSNNKVAVKTPDSWVS